MNSRFLFKKRKSYKKIIFFIICLLILLAFFYFFILSNKKDFIIIPENTNVFYIIPKDRGGEKVLNLDKKSLNSISNDTTVQNLEKYNNLLFSIQFFTDIDVTNVNKFLKKLTHSDEAIYSIDDFYILAFTSEIGTEYFLLYKNFTTRLEATTYCTKFLPKMDNCLIVDTTKF